MLVWDWAIEMGCIIRWGGQNRPDRDGCIGVNRTTGTICVKALRWDPIWGIQGTAKKSVWFKVIKGESGNEHNGWKARNADLVTITAL